MFLRASGLLIFAARPGCRAVAVRGESNWPRWRGPQQNGHTTETDLPVKWSDGNLVWKDAAAGNWPVVADHLGRPDFPHRRAGQRRRAAGALRRSQERQDSLAADRLEGHAGAQPRA